jgi:hypothetical protein
MAHPDYSLIIVERFDPVLDTVSRDSYIFSNVKDARQAFKVEVGNANTRVLLFEQPQPTKFHRDDTVSIPTNLDQWD